MGMQSDKHSFPIVCLIRVFNLFMDYRSLASDRNLVNSPGVQSDLKIGPGATLVTRPVYYENRKIILNLIDLKGFTTVSEMLFTALISYLHQI